MDGLRSLIARHSSHGLLLDTNLLLLYGIGLYSRTFIGRFKRTRQYETEDYDWLHGFVASFQRIITTPHILAELSNLAIDSRNGTPLPYLPALLALIREAKELHVEKDAVLGMECLPKLGVTDTVTLELARRRGYLVLSDDFPLLGYLGAFGCEAINLNHIRSARWRS